MTSSFQTGSHTETATAHSERILAIDYGRRRLGLSISDELGLTAETLPAQERKNRREDTRRLRELVRRHNVRIILVGLPVHLDGRRGKMADEAAGFAERIGKELGLPVELRDERLTSWEAEELRKQSGGARRKRVDIDSISAAILLQERLEERKGQLKKWRADGMKANA